jgi:hypothetical protein
MVISLPCILAAVSRAMDRMKKFGGLNDGPSMDAISKFYISTLVRHRSRRMEKYRSNECNQSTLAAQLYAQQTRRHR